MSIVRSVLLLTLVSLIAAVGLLLLGSLTGYKEFRGGYAALAVDDTIEDMTLLALLGIDFSGGLVSESTQWVMLDEFGSLQKIPLDEYSSRLFSFDPRNDGYAEKLRNIFVRDGKRFVYIPLDAGKSKQALLDKQFNYLFEDIPFSVEYYGVGKPLSLYFVIYAIASIGLLAICYVKRKTCRGTMVIIPLIPVFSSLAFFGASGIACAAVLFGLFFMLREPLNDIGGLFSGIKTPKHKIYREIVKPYTFNFLLLPLFAAALAIMLVFSQLTLLFLTAVFIAALAVFILSSKTMSVMAGNRRRFNPVLIIRRRLPDFSFSIFMTPFAASAFIAMFLSPFIQGSYISGGKFDAIIDEQDYYAHLIYQVSFSSRQLGTSNFDFPDFIYDKDGLPSLNNISGISENINLDAFPSFPLKELMDFFNDVNSGEKTNGKGDGGGILEKLSLLILLLFILPGLIIKRKDIRIRKAGFYGIKNNAGTVRFTGFNRNKSNVYRKEELCIRKDA